MRVYRCRGSRDTEGCVCAGVGGSRDTEECVCAGILKVCACMCRWEQGY